MITAAISGAVCPRPLERLVGRHLMLRLLGCMIELAWNNQIA